MGMHRSGTSIITRLLNLHGVTLAKKLTKANEFNELGYWENLEFQKINDEILNYVQSAWFDCNAPVLSTIPKEKAKLFKEQILGLLKKNFNGPSPVFFAVKDPRITKILPLWHDALESFGAEVSVIIPFRNPLEVAASLERRDAMTHRYSLFLWLSHMLDSERFSRDLNRAFVSFDGLLADWKLSMAKLAEELGIEWPIQSSAAEKSVKEFISPQLKHHHQTDADIKNLGLLGESILKILTQLKTMELGQSNVNTTREFDDVHEAFERVFQKPTIIVPTVVEKYVSHQRHIGSLKAGETNTKKLEMSCHLYATMQALETFELESTAEKEHKNAANKAKVQLNEVGKLKLIKTKLTEQLGKIQLEKSNQKKTLYAHDTKLRKSKEKLENQAKQLKSEQNLASKLQTELSAVKPAIEEMTEELKCGHQENVTLAFQQDFQARKLNQLHSQLVQRDRDVQQRNLELSEMNTSVKVLRIALEQLEKINREHMADLARRFEEIAALTRDIEAYRQANVFGIFAFLQPVLSRIRTGVTLLRTRRHARLVGKSGLFDHNWYLQKYPDVLAGGVDPIEHYLQHGAHEGRNPNPEFDTYSYFLANPDVAADSINPLVHYIKFGSKKGRNPSRCDH